MRRQIPFTLRLSIPLVALVLVLAQPALAQLPLGATAPAFTKAVLGGGSVSASQYQGKVLVLFMLGYG